MKYLEGSFTGINIQWPWSQLLIKGEKLVETRSYPLPRKMLGIPLALIETPGPQGKKNGVSSARIIGLITFERSYLYTSERQWLEEKSLHLVSKMDKTFGFRKNRPKWAWVVSSVEPKTASPPPKVRGIIFARNCKVSVS